MYFVEIKLNVFTFTLFRKRNLLSKSLNLPLRLAKLFSPLNIVFPDPCLKKELKLSSTKFVNSYQLKQNYHYNLIQMESQHEAHSKFTFKHHPTQKKSTYGPERTRAHPERRSFRKPLH